MYSVDFVFFPPGYIALWDSRTPHRAAGERVSWCLETSSLLRLPSWDGSPSLTLLSLFLSFIFCPTSFRRVGLLFWVPDVLCQHSEVVFWNFLSIQMFFWWISGGESGLPVLFLHHLRTAPLFWHYLWRRLSLLYRVTFASLSKISWLFLGSLVYFHWSICVLFCHCHAVLITIALFKSQS